MSAVEALSLERLHEVLNAAGLLSTLLSELLPSAEKFISCGPCIGVESHVSFNKSLDEVFAPQVVLRNCFGYHACYQYEHFFSHLLLRAPV